MHVDEARSNPDSWTEADSAAVQVVSEQRTRFLSFVRSCMDDGQVAEDILQMAYLKLFAHANELRDPSRATAWFFRVLRNLVVDHYRSHQRNAKFVTLETPENVAAQPTPQHNVCPCLAREIDRLHPAYAEALRSVVMADRAVAHYARKSKINENNAAVRLHRARRALRSRLEQVCGPCAGAGCFDCTCA